MDPIKLKHIVERAAVDEQLLRADRLQRGELSTEEAEALRTSSDPEERALYDLFRPLDDLEKQRILSATKRHRSSRVGVALLGGLCAAAICALVFVGSLRSDPAQVRVHSLSAQTVNGSRVLGVSASEPSPSIDLGGCTAAVLHPSDPDKRIPAEEKLQAYFRQGDVVIPWHTSFQRNPVTGVMQGTESCMRIPAEGLSVGTAQLVIVHGRSLPSESEAMRAIRRGRQPWWASWRVESTEVVLRQPAK